MSTTKNDFTTTDRKEEKYYYSKEKAIIYKENRHYYFILKEWRQYLEASEYSRSESYQKERNMIYFLDFLENNNMFDLTTLDSSSVLKYINNYPDYYRKQTIKNYNKHLRGILRFLFSKRYIKQDLSIFVPTIKTSKCENIPATWTEEEIQKIFKEIELDKSLGKRIYLILLLSIRYGLRACDIRNLKFENIDWKNQTIKLTQTKTKKEISFPLLPDVFSALVDYIKNERPKTDEPYIIVNVNGNKFVHASFYDDIGRIINKTDISCTNRKKGIHSMRHTLASSLLKENIPLPIISTILGHSNTASTTTYLKVDEKQLIKCCLPLVEVQLDV